MRVPLSWLKEYVSLDGVSVSELSERLTTAGLEVASTEYIGVPGPVDASHLVWDSETIRVGEIVSVEAHPDADRLRLVTVVYGDGEPKTVVTGAPNVRVGQKVAYAATGATIINGYSEAREHVRLEPKKLRGVLSEGMVLSERELGLSDSHEGIMELAVDAPTGVPLQQYLGDIVLEIDLTPNMGRAASIIGVAREVAALFDRELRAPEVRVDGEGSPVRDAIRIEIREPELNPRFVASLIRNVEIGPSPAWMQRRLRLVGVRPINNVVDITNYVMMELGQPLHAFDYDRLVERAERSGAKVPTIITRLAEQGEVLETLDDVVRTLHPEDILVTDTEGILSIAGIMGGAETEVSESTRNVLLEAASWDFISIRRTGNRHLLFSEAAFRFSRGVHPAMALRGNQRATELMERLCNGEVARGVVDAYPLPAPSLTIELVPAYVSRLLGVELASDTIANYLQRLEFEVERSNGALHISIPDHRTDVSIPADLVEEIARVHGLNNLPLTLMNDALPPIDIGDRALTMEEQVRDLLIGAGLTETISYYMTAPEREQQVLQYGTDGAEVDESAYVRIVNPGSLERRVMRRSLLPSIVETLQSNVRHRERLAVFEMGRVYLPREGELLPEEPLRLAIAMTGPVHSPSWLEPQPRMMDFFDIKGVIEEILEHLYLSERVQFEAAAHPTLQPGRTAHLLLDGEPVGVIGEMHPVVREANDLPEQRIMLADIDIAALLAAVPTGFTVVPIPRYPSVVQDLAVVVDEAVNAGEVAQVIWESGAETVDRVELFDVYRGGSIPAGKKSLAYSLRYTNPERTLTDAEVAEYHAVITDALRARFGALIRGEEL